MNYIDYLKSKEISISTSALKLKRMLEAYKKDPSHFTTAFKGLYVSEKNSKLDVSEFLSMIIDWKDSVSTFDPSVKNNYDLITNLFESVIANKEQSKQAIKSIKVNESLKVPDYVKSYIYEDVNLFETVLSIETPKSNITINSDDDNLDGLNYLAGKGLDYVNKKAMEGTIEAHVSGDVPNIVIELPVLTEETVGHLIYFFEKACAMSGMILGVNPFNQPGVEKYKKNMFKLLEKPGY